MDIDSAKRADVLGRGVISPDGVGARRKSPRASVGAGRASVGGRSEASKGGRTSAGPAKHAAVPERRVLFSDDVQPAVAHPKKKLTNAEREEAARVEFTDKVREETGAILSPEWRVKWVSVGGANSQRKDRRYVAPDGAVYSGPAAVVQRIRSHGTKGLVAAPAPAPAADADADAEADSDDEAVMPTQAAPPRDWEEEDLTPARRRSLGGFARGIVDTFASAFKSRGAVEDSAAKPSSGDDDVVADSEDDAPAAENDEADEELLAQAKADLVEQVLERAGVRLSDAWQVRFETGGGMERGRKRKRFFSPEGNKYSSQSKVLDLVMRQLAKGDVDVPVVTCGEIPGWFARWGSPRRRASAPAAASRFSPRRERSGANPESPVFQPNVPSPLLSPAAKAAAAAAAAEKATPIAKKAVTPTAAKKAVTPTAAKAKAPTPAAKKAPTPTTAKTTAKTPTPAKKAPAPPAPPAPASDPAETTPAPARRASPRTSTGAAAIAAPAMVADATPRETRSSREAKTTPESAAKEAATPRRTPRASAGAVVAPADTPSEATRSSPRAAAAAAAAVAAAVASVATVKAPSPVAASPPAAATRVSPRASSRTTPPVAAPAPEKDPAKALDQLRRKMEMKLDHELEEGWRVEWEPGANGREEKVYYDPAAPGKRLLGDAMALTHVKMRLAALAVQLRAAAEAAAKMATDAKAEERAAAEAYAAVAAQIAVSSDPATMVQLGAAMDAARDALRQKSEWAVFAAEQATAAAQKLSPAERAKLAAGQSSGSGSGSGSDAARALPAPASASVPALPAPKAASTPGTATKTPVGASKEERARVELVERVYSETGVRLGPDWQVTYRPKSDGTFHRYIFSPGGKRFLSGTALVNHVKDFKARAMAVEGEAIKSPEQIERERIEDEEFSKEEATARRELLKQVFDETGVMLGANWRVSMERSWSTAKRRMVGRMRFFAPAPENKKFSSKADVVDFVERQVRRGKLRRHSAPKRPRGVSADAAPTRGAKASRAEDGSRKTSSAVAVARTPASREEAAVAELADRVYAATGITLKPGYEVRWVRENSGKEYKRFFCPAGKRYSSPGELIAALKKQHEKEQAEGECERRNLAAEMDLAADDAPAKTAPRKVPNVARDRQRREGAGKTLALPAPPAAANKPALKSALKKPTKTLAASKSSSSSLAAPTPALPRRDKRAPTPTATRAMTTAEKSSLAQVRDRVREELGVELNKGWSVVIASRKTGASSGTTDKYFIAPSVPKNAPEGFTTRVKFRSETEVVNYARQLFGVPSSKKRSRAAKSAPASTAAAAKTNKPNKAAKTATGKTAAATRAEEEEEMDEEDELDVDDDVGSSDDDEPADDGSDDSDSSDSEGADAGEKAYGVQVEGMLTVMDADAARRAFEKRVLTPAKARELEEHIESQLANPSMGFDVDVLQLEYQRVTGFEALTDDPMELREMLQNVVQREKEKALAAAGGDAAGMFSPETRAAIAATTGNDEGGGGREGGRPRRGEASKRAADVLRKLEQTRRGEGGDRGGEEGGGGGEASRDGSNARARRNASGKGRDASLAAARKEKETAEEDHRGMRVARTLGNVGLNDAKRKRAAWAEEEDDEDDDEDDEEEVIEAEAAETTANPLVGGGGDDDESPPGSQEEVVQKPTDGDGAVDDGIAAVAPVATAAVASATAAAAPAHARGVATRWNPADASMVAQAKSALHTSTAPGEVRCREAERKRVVDLIQRGLKSKRSASMYVCGLPGTGKSLTVSEAEKVARSWGDGSKLGGGSKHACARADRPRVAAVNCMALAEPRHVFARIIEELGGTPPSAPSESGAVGGAAEATDVSQLPEVAALRALVADHASAGSGSGAGSAADRSGPARARGVGSGGASAGSHRPMTVILLDEMDQLVSKAQGILYELFGLPTLPGSRCVVVGVANGINLVEVTLPRLAARGCEPVVVRFNAYDRDQLKLLLRQRLGSLPWTVFEDAGLELCARKVAAATGDMRRALNICAAAVDLCAREANEAAAEAEERDAASAGSAEGITPSRRRARFPSANASLVKISHMARAISASFSSPVVDTMRGLPQHQQMVLCAAVRLFRDATRREATLGVLNDKYTALCKEAGIRGLTPGEFSGVCTVLADQTLLKVGPGREDRQRKTSLAVHQDDVVFALQGVNFFRNLIGDKGGARGGR